MSVQIIAFCFFHALLHIVECCMPSANFRLHKQLKQLVLMAPKLPKCQATVHQQDQEKLLAIVLSLFFQQGGTTPHINFFVRLVSVLLSCQSFLAMSVALSSANSMMSIQPSQSFVSEHLVFLWSEKVQPTYARNAATCLKFCQHLQNTSRTVRSV